MLAGVLMCCKEVKDSCPAEGQSGWSLLVPYTFGFAQAEAVESAQDVAQVSDFIQKFGSLTSVQCPA